MAKKHGKRVALLREVSVRSSSSPSKSFQQSRGQSTRLDEDVRNEEPQEVILKEIPRNPEVPDGEMAAQREMLLTQARGLLLRGTKSNEAAGRAYNKLKPFHPHGDWVPFLKTEAARVGISFRTLQEYMRMAREKDDLLKKEKSAHFGEADDPYAQSIRSGNERAKTTRTQTDQQLASPANSTSNKKSNTRRKAGIYRLPLSLTGLQKLYLDALRGLPNWGEIELAIILHLETLFVSYRVVADPAEPGIHEDREGDTTTSFTRLEADLNSGAASDAAQV